MPSSPKRFHNGKGKQKIDDGWKMASSWEPLVDLCCLFSVELLNNPQTRPRQLPHWNVDWPSAQQRSVAVDPVQLRKWIRSIMHHLCHTMPYPTHIISNNHCGRIKCSSVSGRSSAAWFHTLLQSLALDLHQIVSKLAHDSWDNEGTWISAKITRVVYRLYTPISCYMYWYGMWIKNLYTNCMYIMNHIYIFIIIFIILFITFYIHHPWT